jgi:hypothetical protein
MTQASALFAPTVEVREVLEAFLADDVLVTGWEATLNAAAIELDELGSRWSDREMTSLAEQVRRLAHDGLREQRVEARMVADQVAQLLQNLRVPGVPQPGDADWSF